MIPIRFGANDNIEDQGEAFPCNCPKCHKEVFLHFVKSKVALTVWHVPVAESDTAWYLICPECGLEILLQEQDIERARSANEWTLGLLKARASHEDIRRELADFKIEVLERLLKATVEWRCNNCGNAVPATFDTCWNCGASAPSEAGVPGE